MKGGKDAFLFFATIIVNAVRRKRWRIRKAKGHFTGSLPKVSIGTTTIAVSLEEGCGVAILPLKRQMVFIVDELLVFVNAF
jgi:hypothetical protein